jgi:anaerobic selenocysteine-containing dehydrogenase
MSVEGYQPPLRVAAYISTRKGDPERGPLVRLHPDEARIRVVEPGELVWVYGPRRHELAVLELDPAVPRGHAIVRDVAGIAPSETVHVVKHDFDAGRSTRNLG